ncbi:MAG TPA: hypothetical protein VLS48_02040, partial [Anaerolineales bacterium]|nr:hypothetical protein [Anaerolineales bacterium]
MKNLIGRYPKPSLPQSPADQAGRASEVALPRLSVFARHHQWTLLRAGLVTLDLLLAGAAFRLAFFIRFETGLQIFEETGYADLGYYTLLVGLFLTLLFIIFWIKGLYERENLLGGTREYALLFDSATIWALLIITFSFFQPAVVLARAWLLIAWFLMFILVTVGRFLSRRVVYALRYYGYFLIPAVVV